MTKRIVAFLLLLVMLMGNTFSFAAEGDIIHTGLKRIYSKSSSTDQEELLQDILNGINVERFYKETANGEYVNIVEEENRQLDKLTEIFRKEGISNPEDMQKYVINNKDYVERELAKISEDLQTSFDGIGDEDKGVIEDYKGASNALTLNNKVHYSTPEPGSKEGTTKISKLNLPTNSGASNWQIKVTDEGILPMTKDTELKNGIRYIGGHDIEIEAGKYIVLYAIDRNNKIKGYANIKITEDMIKQPREEAAELKVGQVVPGKEYAGTIIIEGLKDNLPEETDKWQVIVSDTSIDKIYKGDKIDGAVDYNNDEIIVANEDELHNIKDNFKKYIVLIAANNDGLAIGYKIFEIGKENISKPAIRLEEDTHYIGPVAGDEDGTTKFTKLEFGDTKATNWIYKLSKTKINIPISDKLTVPLSENENIPANVGDYLLLAATDGDKIKGYRIFELDESHIKGKTAKPIEDENIKLEKGSKTGTTKVVGLNIDGIDGATKWMYKVGEDLPTPILDKVVAGSMDYTIGQDIEVLLGEDILILATDDENKVKAFVEFKPTKDDIKDSPPVELKEGTHYSRPVKGSTSGTTKFEILTTTPSIKDATKWMYKFDKVEFDIPEIDGKVEGSTSFEANDNIGENLKDGDYLLLLATNDEGETKGYATFKLTESQIKMPNAPKLKSPDNYSNPEPGTIGGTTRIDKLELFGIEDATEWKYIVLEKEHPTPIEINTVVDRTVRYNAGNNIRAEVGDYLLLIATDNRGKTKAYKQIKLEGEHIREPNAAILKPTTNYKGPEPGSESNSTKFSFLSHANIDKATKWMYAKADKTFGPIELNSTVANAENYNVGEDIENVSVREYLLLLATDNEGKVKAYKEFRLVDKDIRGGNAVKLKDINYTIERGNMPGTAKFSQLGFYGVEGANRWKYKLIDQPLENKPYMNSIVEDTIFYNIKQDIQVEEISKDNPKYGYILLLAVDNGGRTKGYGEIPISNDMVKEHAPTLNINIKKGSVVDSVKFIGKLSTNTLVKYKLTNNPYPTPAIDDELRDGIDYTLDENITKVRVGQYINIFAVDKDNKIQEFKSFKIESDDIMQGTATMQNETLLEGNIVNGGEKIEITLTDAKWAEDIKTNENKRNALYRGFRPSDESTEWTKVVNRLISDGSGAIGVDLKNNKLTVLLPETTDYDISKDQLISLNIPAIAIEEAINPIKATGTITIKPTVKATISGDVTNSIVREKDIIAGGKTIVIELEDGDWVTDVNTDKLIDGFESDGKKWGLVKEKIETKHIRRNSSKKLTITLPNVNVNFGTTKETIKLTINEDLIEGATTNVAASPTFTLYPDVLRVEGKSVEDTVTMEAPDNKIPRKNMDTWIIEVETGTLKDEIANKDIVVAGLPRGLRANVEKVDDKQITIKISGTASSSINTDQEVSIRIKGTAVTEPNSMDSDDIKVSLKPSAGLNLKNIGYEITNENIYLVIPEDLKDEKIQYSIDSTNGINGKWDGLDASFKIEAKPIKIWIRETAQPMVSELVVDLKQKEAPKNVSIESIEYSEVSGKIIKKVKLAGTDIKMEYSKDGGDSWIPLTDEITLDESSDLRVRYKAVEGPTGEIPSLSTKRLNGLYLGNVEVNAGQGKIINTNTTIEYSLNSTNGQDGSWKSGRNGETLVSFTKNEVVWIRERGNQVNNRELATIGQEDTPKVNSITYSIKDGNITNVDNTLEYRIANGNWIGIHGNKVLGVEFKPGKLEFRKKGTEKNLASEPEILVDISKPAEGPTLKTDDYNKKIFYLENDQWVEINDNYQYKIGSTGDWKDGSHFKDDPNKNENIVIYVRKSATDKELPSKETSANFTKNIELEDIDIDVAQNLIIGTTNNMEYSIDSTDGIDGTWINCNNNETTVKFVQGMDLWIREKNKPKNKLKIAQSIPKEAIPNLTYVYYNIGTNKIANNTNNDLEYRINDSDWEKIDRNSDKYEVDFKAGKLEFRKSATKNSLPSNPKVKVIIKAPASIPAIEWDDVENNITEINGKDNGWDIFEYRMDNSHWITGELLNGEDLTGNKVVEIRTKAAPKELPSQIAELKFTANLPLKHVILSTHVQPLELNGTTTQMEYRINNGEWKACTEGNTKLKRMDDSDLNDIDVVKIIEIRDKYQKENQYTVYQN